MSEQTTIIERGSRVRVTETHRTPADVLWHKGTTLIVDEYISAEEADDGFPFYLVVGDKEDDPLGDIEADKVMEITRTKLGASLSRFRGRRRLERWLCG